MFDVIIISNIKMKLEIKGDQIFQFNAVEKYSPVKAGNRIIKN